MKWSSLKKKVAGTAFIFALLLGSGMMFETTAQAQYRDRDRNWQRDRDDRRDRDGDWYRRRQNERARELARERWERSRNRDAYVYRGTRTYPYGSYGNYGGSASNYEVQKGYRDGLDRGQEDARDRRSFNPNNSSHYRSGNAAYREGFRRGYDQGYRQYSGSRRWPF